MKNEEYRNRPTQINYHPVQLIGENDTRTIEDRLYTLPVIREEELPEWESWWNRTFVGLNHNVPNNR